MKNVFLALILAISMIACDKKNSQVDPQPIVIDNQYPLDTAFIQNKWWVKIVDSGSQRWYYKYFFNSNDTYTQKNIFEDSQYGTSDTTIGNGIYYFERGGNNNNEVSIYLNGSPATSTYYAPFTIELTTIGDLKMANDIFIKE